MLQNKSWKHNGGNIILWVCLAFVISCILILSSVPPVSRDALTHHLTIPKMYLTHGGIYEIPSISFSYFPMNLDLLYLIPLYFKTDIPAKYIHFGFALLTAWLIHTYLKQVLNRTYGLLGALLFLTIPVVVKLSVTVYVDLGLIFFSWACLYFTIKWYDTMFLPRYIVLAGIACGLALGTKYNGLILLPIMGTAIPILYTSTKNKIILERDWRTRYKNSISGLGWATVFITVAMIVFSPWMARNIYWKQNPVYPLYNRVFNPPKLSAEVSSAKKVKEKKPPKNAFWKRRHVYKESFLETLFIPVRAFFQGQDDEPKYFDGRLNPFLLLFPFLAFILGRQAHFTGENVHRILFAVFAVLFVLFVLFQSDFRIRYMSPAIPPLVVLSVFGIRNLAAMISQRTGKGRRLWWGVYSILILSAFLYNADYIHGLFYKIRPFEYLSGKVDRDSYITRYRREYPVILYANKTLPQDARVLCLSIGDRTYYLDREAHLADDFYVKNKDGLYLEKTLLRKLKRYGTTHIILDRRTMFGWLRTLPENEQDAFLKVFKKNTRVLHKENNVLLLALEV